MSEQKPFQDVIKEAKEKLLSLKSERQARPGNGHPDSRVPGEITPHLRALGWMVKGFIQQRERQLVMIEANKVHIAEAEDTIAQLKLELDISLNLAEPSPPEEGPQCECHANRPSAPDYCPVHAV